MQKLYNDTFQFFKKNNAESLQSAYDRFNVAQYTQRPGSSSPNRQLANLIYAINNAKKDNIDENAMEQFAYTQQNVDNGSLCATLFFNLLKRYNIIARQTNELLPFQPDATESCLLQTFCVPIDKRTHGQHYFHNTTYGQQYPAFSCLLHKLCYLDSSYYKLDLLYKLTSWMHSNKKIILDNYSAGTSTNVTTEFYGKVCALLSSKNQGKSQFYQSLYELIQIIEQAKNNNTIREYSFGKNILNLTPEMPVIKLIYPEFPLINRQKAALFYAHIQKYNTARSNKTTPTPLQHMIYLITQDLNLCIPDFLSNTILNDNTYAFDELRHLYDDAIILDNSTEKEVQECVEQIYNC